MKCEAHLLGELANGLGDLPERAALELRLGDDAVSVRVGPDRDRMASAEVLHHLIGPDRLLRICDVAEVGVSRMRLIKGDLRVTKSLIRRLFVGMGDIRESDLPLHKSTKCIDETYERLFPFERVEVAFLGRLPRLGPYDFSWVSGKGFRGLKERVYMLHHDRKLLFERLGDPDAAAIHRAEKLSTRLADREPPVGTLVRVPEGYRRVDATFASGGAYIFSLVHLHDPVSHPPLLVCRGTAPRHTPTGAIGSILNDVQFELGLRGIERVWPEIRAYLKDHRFGAVELLGRSLGGAHAQMLVPLVQSEGIAVVGLTTVGSTGVHTTVHEKFDETLPVGGLDHHVIRSSGADDLHQVDYIPILGGKMLGADKGSSVRRKVTYVGRPDTPLERIAFHRRLPSKVALFWKSFARAHVYMATLHPFHHRHVECPVATADEFSQTEAFEYIRRWVASGFHLLSLGRLNRRSYADLFQ